MRVLVGARGELELGETAGRKAARALLELDGAKVHYLKVNGEQAFEVGGDLAKASLRKIGKH